MLDKNQARQPSASKSHQAQPSNSTCEVTTLRLAFDLHLYPRQITRWRGAIAESAKYAPLFHNHYNPKPITQRPAADDPAAKKYNYLYPLIQYRSEGGKAALFGINEGAEALRTWVMQTGGKLKMGGRIHDLRLTKLEEEKWQLQMLPHMATYRLMDWVPLNQENYAKWRAAKNLTERVALLENILAGNLLSLANGLNWQLPQRMDVCLLHIRNSRKVQVHRENRIAFNVLFKVNMELPNGAALGRSVAFGYGTFEQCSE